MKLSSALTRKMLFAKSTTMKPTALIIFMLLSTSLYSQIQDDNLKRIKVTGQSQVEIKATSYVIDIQIREVVAKSMNYNDPIKVEISIDSLEQHLRNNLVQAGYDPNKLKLSYMNTANYGDAYKFLFYNTYEYALMNLNDVNAFIRKVHFEGLTGMRVRKIFDINKSEIEAQLFKDALADARRKAETLLVSTGKKLGEIISIDMNAYQPAINDENSNNWHGNTILVDAKMSKTISASISVKYEIK